MITASYDPSNGILNVYGDTLANKTTIGRNAEGRIVINGGAIPIQGGTPTIIDTVRIQVFGQDGNDTIRIDETNGPMPAAYLFAGTGDDSLTGASGNDMLFGQSGNDTLAGGIGDDAMFGGTENDVLTGGAGNDQLYGESGDDRMIWNSGDGSDLLEGGAGIDTGVINGGIEDEIFAITANGTRVRVDRLEPAPSSLDIGTTEHLVFNLGAGNDTISAVGNLAALVTLTIDGGAGNDTILGSNGADTLHGGIGNDFIDGQQGNDIAYLGAGDDVYGWDPGDGSDTVDGQGGTDTLRFNGSSGNEVIDLSANGTRALLTRNLGVIAMDLNGIERVQVAALGGADTVNVRSMTGTHVRDVSVDLAGQIGGTTGDAQADTVIVNGGDAAESIRVETSGTTVTVRGLTAVTSVRNAESFDRVTVNAMGGNDTINASTIAAGTVLLTLDGGGGDDRLLGSAGADTFLGGDGNDFADGNQGNDFASLGNGDDSFVWNAGDGNDVIEGGDGFDTLTFNGATVAENFDIAANLGRAFVARNVDAVFTDLNDVERIDLLTGRGADNVVVGDLTGTDVRQVAIDLARQAGSTLGDGAADRVTVNGSQGVDAVTVAAAADGSIVVDGLTAQVTIARAEGALDRLAINGLAGDDTIDASALQAGRIALEIHGGLGNDVLLGSQGSDLVTGGDGNDVARLGAGDDTFVWNPGDDNDVVEGGAGTDTLQFNGANAAEYIGITAAGGRVTMTRDVAAISMDLDDVERIAFRALGGADRIGIADMSGTDVRRIDVDLSGPVTGTGDGLADMITATATAGDDVVRVIRNGTTVSITGLPAEVVATNVEADRDRIAVVAGDGADVLIGTAGHEELYGGNGNDVLIANGGVDVLDGGAGDDLFVAGFTTGAVITTFAAGAGSEDRLDLSVYGPSIDFDWVMSHALETDIGVMLNLGAGNSMTVLGVTLDMLHEDDFVFAGDAADTGQVRHGGIAATGMDALIG